MDEGTTLYKVLKYFTSEKYGGRYVNHKLGILRMDLKRDSCGNLTGIKARFQHNTDNRVAKEVYFTVCFTETDVLITDLYGRKSLTIGDKIGLMTAFANVARLYERLKMEVQDG